MGPNYILLLSLLANIGLIIALFVTRSRTRSKIIQEKSSTFAGCLAALTSGLAIDDIEERLKIVSFFLASLCKGTDTEKEEVKFYLTRASLLRVFRQPALADLGEHMRLLALESVGDDDEPGSQMLEYISQSQGGDKEPRDLWGDDGLGNANLVAEKKILGLYRSRITAVPVRLFN